MAPGFLRKLAQPSAADPPPKAPANDIGGPLVGGTLPLDSFLPEGVPDSVLASELQTFGHVLGLHVHNNYRSDVVAAAAADPHGLAGRLRDGLGFGKESAAVLAKAVTLPAYRPRALQSILAQAVLANAVLPRPGMSTHFSLLPPGLTALAAAQAPVEASTGNEEVIHLARMRWRRMAVFLLHPRRSERSPLPARQTADDPGLDARIDTLVAALVGITGAFAKDGAAQEAALRNVVREGAKLGYLMVSQPAEVQFVFGGKKKRKPPQPPVEAKENGAGGEEKGKDTDQPEGPLFLQLPGLAKTTEDQGRILARPLRLVDPVWA